MAETPDWETRVITKSASKKPKTEAGIDRARRAGELETVKKVDGGKNKKGAAVVTAGKLDDPEPADFKHATITLDFKLALQKARVDKKWSQKELAAKVNVKQSIINDYESGKAIPDPALISKLNRALGVVLPKIPKKKAKKDED
eukprot:TRINITY_DN1719_c0_g1_i22.p1 TRINITY_DN1719_c0_g1~~TRINITY_DN1719_c0_g1_i22.p1  ORF type:complete len:144 (+),score=36.26 TRINITY_DN1719_c0_g1_i22:91-522(+)